MYPADPVKTASRHLPFRYRRGVDVSTGGQPEPRIGKKISLQRTVDSMTRPQQEPNGGPDGQPGNPQLGE